MRASGARAAATIAGTELTRVLRSPAAWGLHGAFLLLHGGLFILLIELHGSLGAAAAAGAMTEPAAGLLAPPLRRAGRLLLVFSALVTMGTVAEHPSTELHLAAPVRPGAVVVGLWGAATARLLALAAAAWLAPLLVPVVRTGHGPRLVAAAAAVALLTASGCALGTLASALAARRTTAVLVSATALAALWTVGPGDLPSLAARWQRLAEGLVEASDVGFFVAATVAALALASVALESRRW